MKLLTALTLRVAVLFASPALASAAPGNQPSDETYNHASSAAAGSDKQNPAARHGKHGKHGKRGQQAHQGQRGQGQQGPRGQKRKMIKRAMLQRFDRNGDRRLDPSERAAIKATFDTNRDGKIDRTERHVLKQSLRPTQPPALTQPNQAGPTR